ncbi:MAG: acyl-CoA thioesterase II [Porticoccaceae bacterium]
MNSKELLKLLTLEQLDDGRFEGQNQDIGAASVFGGQVVGQALAAAEATVEGRPAHSLHSYFLRPGNKTIPIIYDVERVRDGGSFSTRRVVAEQQGEVIFILSASFQKTESGFDHQTDMPDVPAPEDLPDESEIRLAMATSLEPERQAFFTSERPVEMRPLYPDDLWNKTTRPAQQGFWLRVNTEIPDSPKLHRALLAYASDFYLMGTALRPHGERFSSAGMLAASLDHAMWFHRDFRINEWMLYTMDSPTASGGRGLNLGSFYKRDGTLVATCMQEGLMRMGRK